MIKRTVFIGFICALSILYAQYTLAGSNEVRSAPQLLNYQGYLTDTLGIPITTTGLSMTFRIYNASSGGGYYWTETQSVDVEDGVFHVILGSITPIPYSVFKNATTRWLQLYVDGQTMSPRTRITAAAYSYTSSYSDTAGYALDVATSSLDSRYVNVIGPDSMYASSSLPTLRVKAHLGGWAIYVTRDATATTAAAILADNAGSGAGVQGDAAATDGASPGVLGRHSGGVPGVYGTSGAWVGAPLVSAGVAGYSATGPALLAASGSSEGLRIEGATNQGIRIMGAGAEGIDMDYIDDVGIRIDSTLYTAYYVEHAYANGVGIDTTDNDGYAILYPGRDAFGLWGTAGRHGVYLNSCTDDGVNINYAGGNGVQVDSTSDDAFSTDYAYYYGLQILKSRLSGIRIDTTVQAAYSAFYIHKSAGNGCRIFRAVDNGFEVDSAGDHGLVVADTRRHGVCITSADSSGLKIYASGHNAIDIESAAQYGIDIDSTYYDGIWVHKAMQDGIDFDSVGADGVDIGYCDYGVRIADAVYRGVYVVQADDYGVYIANADDYGVYANSNAERGGYFRNNNNSYYPLTAWNNTGTGGTVRGLYIQGHGYATGGWQTFLENGGTGFSVTSTDMELIISGSSSLSNGMTAVSFDSKTQNAISKSVPIKVIITPTSMCNGICVINKTSAGFEATELLNGRSDATFDWIAIARIKGYEKAPVTQPIIVEEPELNPDKEKDAGVYYKASSNGRIPPTPEPEITPISSESHEKKTIDITSEVHPSTASGHSE